MILGFGFQEMGDRICIYIHSNLQSRDRVLEDHLILLSENPWNSGRKLRFKWIAVDDLSPVKPEQTCREKQQQPKIWNKSSDVSVSLNNLHRWPQLLFCSSATVTALGTFSQVAMEIKIRNSWFGGRNGNRWSCHMCISDQWVSSRKERNTKLNCDQIPNKDWMCSDCALTESQITWCQELANELVYYNPVTLSAIFCTRQDAVLVSSTSPIPWGTIPCSSQAKWHQNAPKEPLSG